MCRSTDSSYADGATLRDLTNLATASVVVRYFIKQVIIMTTSAHAYLSDGYEVD
jgi:hypothetical protein